MPSTLGKTTVALTALMLTATSATATAKEALAPPGAGSSRANPAKARKTKKLKEPIAGLLNYDVVERAVRIPFKVKVRRPAATAQAMDFASPAAATSATAYGVMSTGGGGAVAGDTAAAMGMTLAFAPELAPVLAPVMFFDQMFQGFAQAKQITALQNQVNQLEQDYQQQQQEIQEEEQQIQTLARGMAVMQGEINAIDQALVFQQGEVNTLYADLGKTNALLAAAIAQQSQNNYCGALNDWLEGSQKLYASSANQINTTTACGQGAQNSSTGVANTFFADLKGSSGSIDLTAAAQDATTLQKLQALATIWANSATSLQTVVGQLSASTIPPNPGAQPFRDVSSEIQGASATTTCAPSPTGDLTASLLACQYAYLMQNLMPTAGQQGQNLVPNLDAYNDMVSFIFQQNLIQLQYAYTLESVSNHLNYLNWKAACKAQTPGVALTQIPSWEPNLASSITFQQASCGNLTRRQARKQLANAQTALAQVYAARINALYIATSTYIVSDPPVLSMAWGQQYSQTMISQAFTPPPYGLNTRLLNANKKLQFPAQQSITQPIPALTLGTGVSTNVVPGAPLLGQYGSQLGILYQYGGITDWYSCFEADPATRSAPPPVIPASTPLPAGNWTQGGICWGNWETVQTQTGRSVTTTTYGQFQTSCRPAGDVGARITQNLNYFNVCRKNSPVNLDPVSGIVYCQKPKAALYKPAPANCKSPFRNAQGQPLYNGATYNGQQFSAYAPEPNWSLGTYAWQLQTNQPVAGPGLLATIQTTGSGSLPSGYYANGVQLAEPAPAYALYVIPFVLNSGNGFLTNFAACSYGMWFDGPNATAYCGTPLYWDNGTWTGNYNIYAFNYGVCNGQPAYYEQRTTESNGITQVVSRSLECNGQSLPTSVYCTYDPSNPGSNDACPSSFPQQNWIFVPPPTPTF